MRHIRGLRIDWVLVEGEVALPDELEESDALFRADVLKDWIFALEQKYDEAVGGLFRDLRSEQRGAATLDDPSHQPDGKDAP